MSENRTGTAVEGRTAAHARDGAGGRSGDGGADEADAAIGQAAPLNRADAERLGTRIQAHAAHIAEAMCAFLLLVAEFESRDALRWYVGLKSTAHWLAWACSMSPGTAREHVRVARALPRMPATVEEFRRGRLSFSKVREMTRLVGRVDEEALLEMARSMTASQLARTVSGFRAAEGTRMPQEAAREASWRIREDGMVEVRAVLPAEVGAEVVTALDRALQRDEAPVGDDDDARSARAAFGTPDISQRKADALLDLARTYLETAPADRSGEDRHLILVHVTPDALAADGVPAGTPSGAGDDPAAQDDPPAPSLDTRGHRDRCGIVGMGPLEPATAQRLVCTGMLALLVTDEDGEVLHLGRTRRLASPAQRRALRATQSTCQFPGCHQSRHLDAHHLVPWSDGGSTDIGDLVLLCRRHHMMVHEGGLTLHRLRDAGGDAAGRGGSRFEVRDRSGRPVQAWWPHVLEHARVAPAEVGHPLKIIDASTPPLHWGAGDVRIAPTSGGYDFHRDDAVSGLLSRRPAEDGTTASVTAPAGR